MDTTTVDIGDAIRLKIGDTAYRSWFNKVTISVDSNTLTIRTPTRFISDWIERNYKDDIINTITQLGYKIYKVQFLLLEAVSSQQEVTVQEQDTSVQAMPDIPIVSDDTFEYTRVDPRHTFDSFCVDDTNQFAYATAKMVACGDNPHYNPIVITGDVGIGKTHLVQAIGNECLATGKRFIYCSAEKFLYSFIKAIKSNTTFDFKDSIFSCDIFAIDDFQFLCGKEKTVEEFESIFKTLVAQGKRVILTMDVPPTELKGLSPALLSRLMSGIVATVNAPSADLLRKVSYMKAKECGIIISDDAVTLLVSRINSIRVLCGAINRIAAYSSLYKKMDITVDLAIEALGELLHSNIKKITIAGIQEHVAKHFKIHLKDMTSSRRSQDVARPRQIAMYLAKQLTSASLPSIGTKFGNRDHTTVMHACNRVTELMSQDSSFAETVTMLQKVVSSSTHAA